METASQTAPACQLLDRFLSAPELKQAHIKACLAAIADSDEMVQAWTYLCPPEHLSVNDWPAGLLSGIAVGIKDIIDVAGWPCAYGSAVFKDRICDKDSEVAQRLRAAGACLIGKTVTTEFAYMQISKTRHPKNARFSPGGSSSGSAASVAAGQIPLAVGTQTGGSVIRPASYCGVHGFKPTGGSIPRDGILQTSQSLDQVGVFATCLQDIALISSVLMADEKLAYVCDKPSKSQKKLLYFPGLYNRQLEGYVHEGLDKIASAIEPHVEIRPAPHDEVSQFLHAHKTIYDFELHHNIGPIATEHPSQMSDEISQAIERGRKITSTDYQSALQTRNEAIAFFDRILKNYDGLMTASATAEAPLFEKGTGNPVCNSLWSLCGFPAVSLPLYGPYQINGPSGLPVGMQIIAAPKQDGPLLATARWLEEQLC